MATTTKKKKKTNPNILQMKKKHQVLHQKPHTNSDSDKPFQWAYEEKHCH